jgi:Tfp pilus assembly protein PilO
MPSLQRQIIWAGRIRWTLATATLLVCVCFYALAYRPQTARQGELRDQISDTNRDLNECLAQTRSLGAVAEDVARLKSRLKQVKELPVQLEWVQFMKDLTQIQQMAALKNANYDGGGEVAVRDRLRQKSITFTFEGDFVNVFSFLRHAEELPRLTRVPLLTIEHRNNDPAGYVRAKMTMNIYCLAD